MTNIYHLCCDSTKGRWEIRDKKENVIHWGNLTTMEMLLDILNK